MEDVPGVPMVGNLLCLDLVNTERMSHGARVDLLASFADLAAWLARAGALDAAEAEAAAARWEGTAEGDEALRSARALRGAIRETASRLVDGEEVGDDALRIVNDALAWRPAYAQLERVPGGFATRTRTTAEGARPLLAPVAESAAWLLSEGDLALLKRCENPQCILYFYDTTKNRSRRWCSMDGCGARHKAAAYYRRRGRGAAAAARRAGEGADGASTDGDGGQG